MRLSGLSVRRELFELDMRQLRFDPEEAAQFYRQRLGQDLSKGDLERLLNKTEGWPAALELVALALSGLTDRGEFIGHLAGTDSSLVEYLSEVLLSRLDEPTRTFVCYLLRQSPKQVVEALNDAIESSQQRGLAHRSVELLLVRALAHKQGGEVASALTDLHQALTLAAPRQYLRVFLDEGSELAALVDALDLERLGSSPAVPLARRLQLARGTPGNQGRSTGTGSGLSEQLTRREVSILKRLESGLSNKEIAEAIFVSEGTLKWHLHNVYNKLNVKNRSGAMVRARTLGIV